MTEITNQIYFVTMTWDEPRGGSMRLPAKDAAEAKEIFTKQFGFHKNFNIIQCIDEASIQTTGLGGVEQTPVLEIPEDDDTPPSQRVH